MLGDDGAVEEEIADPALGSPVGAALLSPRTRATNPFAADLERAGMVGQEWAWNPFGAYLLEEEEERKKRKKREADIRQLMRLPIPVLEMLLKRFEADEETEVAACCAKFKDTEDRVLGLLGRTGGTDTNNGSGPVAKVAEEGGADGEILGGPPGAVRRLQDVVVTVRPAEISTALAKPSADQIAKVRRRSQAPRPVSKAHRKTVWDPPEGSDI